MRYSLQRLRGNTPLDTGHVQEKVINNLEHLYNEHTQTRVNFVGPFIRVGSGAEPLATENPYTYAFSFGPFPLTILKDGSTAPLYVEVAASASAVGTGRVSLVLRTERYPGRLGVTAGKELGWLDVSASSVPVGWSTLATPGNSLLQIPPARIGPYGLSPTRLTGSESVPLANASMVKGYIDVYCGVISASPPSYIDIYGIVAREFYSGSNA